MNDKPAECEACLWTTDDLSRTEAYARVPGQGPFTPESEKNYAWLCEVCNSSYSGMAYCYPRQYENREVLHMIAWSTNRLLSERPPNV